MLFDRLCGLIESGVLFETRVAKSQTTRDALRDFAAFSAMLSLMRKKLEQAALFDFRNIPYSTVAEHMTHETINIALEKFRLPFPICAYDDGISCVVLERIGTAEEGLRDEFMSAEYREDNVGGLHVKLFSIVVFGPVDFYPDGPKPLGMITSPVLAFRSIVKNRWEGRFAMANEYDGARDNFASNVITPVEQSIFASTPKVWIVKQSPPHDATTEKKRPKIARAHQRPTMLVVSEREAVRYVTPDNDDREKGPSRRGHRRRGHWRRISETFRFKGGELVWVRPCWVGPKVAVKHGKRYEVLTDI